jgi:hypothetical protein
MVSVMISVSVPATSVIVHVPSAFAVGQLETMLPSGQSAGVSPPEYVKQPEPRSQLKKLPLEDPLDPLLVLAPQAHAPHPEPSALQDWPPMHAPGPTHTWVAPGEQTPAPLPESVPWDTQAQPTADARTTPHHPVRFAIIASFPTGRGPGVDLLLLPLVRRTHDVACTASPTPLKESEFMRGR